METDRTTPGQNDPGSGDGQDDPGSGDGQNDPGSGDGQNDPGSGDGQNDPGSGDGQNDPGSGDGQNIINFSYYDDVSDAKDQRAEWTRRLQILAVSCSSRQKFCKIIDSLPSGKSWICHWMLLLFDIKFSLCINSEHNYIFFPNLRCCRCFRIAILQMCLRPRLW